MSNTYVYAVLSGECLRSDGQDGEKTLRVVMRFDSAEELEQAGDTLFDDTCTVFNANLPYEWVLDESPELQCTISEAEAEARGYCVYKSDAK